MGRTENVELTVLCLIEDGDKILLQNRVKKDWWGYTLPGGHVEHGESFVDAVIREMREETGLKVIEPRLVGVKQFPIENGRYVVLLFKATQWFGMRMDTKSFFLFHSLYPCLILLGVQEEHMIAFHPDDAGNQEFRNLHKLCS